jgi:acetylornithine deacetylase/succinyl-diaminopimelate desuccinylase-like protein
MNHAVPSEVLSGAEGRDLVADRAEALVDDGSLFALLRRRIALRTQSTEKKGREELLAYLESEMAPELRAMGFSCDILDGKETGNPMLLARRVEQEGLPTIFGYGHGDVVSGSPETWSEGLDPWVLTERDGAWYGRGIVDNKGQHSINLAAMRTVLEARGRLGFNAVWLIEMGEEIGSPGLREICQSEAARLAADVLIASDGPRVSAQRPTLYLGTRGAVNFTLSIRHRDTGHHSGNWGGLLANPAIELSHAIASIVSATGRIRVKDWTPGAIPESVRVALSRIEVNCGPQGPSIATVWGEPGLSAAEQLYGWSSFDVLAMTSGDPVHPVNAVPPVASAHCQLRTVVGVDEDRVLKNLRAHLDAEGFHEVVVENASVGFRATRLDPDDPWVHWVAGSLARTTGKPTAVLPNIGGSLPNDAFSQVLGMRTIWIPHSYPGAQNHGGDEHLPVSVAREALRLMAALYWDLGDPQEISQLMQPLSSDNR